MQFDYQQYLKEIEQQFINLGLQKVPVLMGITTIYINNASDALSKLALSYSTEPDEDFLKARLAEEKEIFISEYLGLAIVSEQIASETRDLTIQTIATTVMQVLAALITNGTK